MEVDDGRATRLGEPGGGARWDGLAEQLQALRRAAGEPSFAEIARRVAEQRLAAGADEHAARVARTTVYDAFRTGRARVNVPLVREIVHALDGDAALVDGWLRAPAPVAAPVAAPVPAPVPAPAPADPAAQATEPAERVRPAGVLLLMTACVLVNLLGRSFVDLLALPVYLDMVGTAVAAIALGPWRGAAVGLASNLAGTLSSGEESIPFALVNIAGALVWGYGARRLGLGRTLPRFLGLNAAAALVCTLVAVPILVLLYDGSTGHGEDAVSATFLAATDRLVVAVGAGNVLVSLGDKVISGFVALVAISALPPAVRAGVDLPLGPTGAPGGPPARRAA
ncbi:hypothetical protein [Nocardioides sp. Arc9.136]|uniref:hypothetical protein n=1 Tax=Nocardioides sp. Arc9.136 TaxID=2996826 RepID=UPI002665FF4C|nr:hypothetical protein [Nocardioides sp. Arc9.136]WKN48438.1 hypothetical protein OSR43_20740 [Nocardioides sp. Arc9.136]